VRDIFCHRLPSISVHPAPSDIPIYFSAVTAHIERRSFLASALAASAASVLPGGYIQAQETGGKAREFYQLRRYGLTNGPQRRLCDDFLRDALVPALNRLSISPVGVFTLTIGPETPSYYVLMPCASVETLSLVEFRLAQDAEYLKAGAAFLNAPAKEPSFARMESWLLQAFENMPKLTLPTASASHSPRVFELRTYESPSDQDHKLKVDMMQSEGGIFAKAGFWPVFYGDTLIGSRLPSLTYMLSYESVAERDKKWAAFGSSPEWKSLSGQPKYAFEDLVSNITNLILTPTAYSQI
jgi:NIPSNAP